MGINLSIHRKLPIIQQSEVAECGLACIAMISSYYGNRMDLSYLRSHYATKFNGMNVQQLLDITEKIGFSSRAIRCETDQIEAVELPCIAHWNMNHFIVIKKIGVNKVKIHDPALGIKTISRDEFSRCFTGIVVELIPTINFKKNDYRDKIKLSQLWASIKGARTSFFYLISLSFIIQICILAFPYYSQFVIDEVITSNDKGMLKTVAFGFGILLLFQVSVSVFRSLLIVRVSSLLNLQLAINVFSHLLKLPINFFETRHTGDLVSRFNSLTSIKEILSQRIVEVIVDGCMALCTVVLMFLYSPFLVLLEVSVISIFVFSRLVTISYLKQRLNDIIESEASEQTFFIETIRNISAIKLLSSISKTKNKWQNLYTDVINSEIYRSRIEIFMKSSQDLILGFETILVMYIGAGLISDAEITLGMFFAFISYKLMFTNSMVKAFDSILEIRMMSVHLKRVSDITNQGHELYRHGVLPYEPCSGSLVLENVSFRYGKDEPYLFEGISLCVKSGESMVITGESGGGKSTLLKIMSGILQPTEGRILVDGRDINKIGLDNYQNDIAAVMQNDSLLSGTIIENITFFDSEPDYEHVINCAKVANIHDHISSLPMGYYSVVGDLGSNLSGGQSQRILLARALYRRPKILFLDEATSALDIDCEKSVCAELSKLDMTRIMIAHREESIKMSHKKLELS
ncbi:peptidase domain-containing ABC transporter [Photobacterium sp. R1]